MELDSCERKKHVKEWTQQDGTTHEYLSVCVKAARANGERRQGPKSKGLKCEPEIGQLW